MYQAVTNLHPPTPLIKRETMNHGFDGRPQGVGVVVEGDICA
jgi:hypothetical protein